MSVVLITGRPGSGKSHHAFHLAQELRSEGKIVRILDGDMFRHQTGNQDFTDAGRIRNLQGLAEAAAEGEWPGHVVIVAAVAPRREWRNMMRAQWQEGSRLVYLPGGCLWPGTTYERPGDDEF
ncbi:MAG: adenylyl-sulfate kinase [Deltaproteobacteria bacterium]|nr:MAG: adenylyl-sulfate kinase [Deltaproteobacteria bacterium]